MACVVGGEPLCQPFAGGFGGNGRQGEVFAEVDVVRAAVGFCGGGGAVNEVAEQQFGFVGVFQAALFVAAVQELGGVEYLPVCVVVGKDGGKAA